MSPAETEALHTYYERYFKKLGYRRYKLMANIEVFGIKTDTFIREGLKQLPVTPILDDIIEEENAFIAFN